MLRVVLRSHLAGAVAALAEDLARPPAAESALARVRHVEWVVTPSLGTRRWVVREASRRLGAATGRTDGVVANWRHTFPAAVLDTVLAADLARRLGPAASDPWRLPASGLLLHEWAQSHPDDPAIEPLLVGGRPTLGRARHLADLFDRYALWRPEMVLDWSAGRPGGTAAGPGGEALRAQGALWRAFRDHLGVPSPAERWDDAWAHLDEVVDRLPSSSRVSVVGLTTFPGGLRFVEALARLATRLDVGVYLAEDLAVTGPEGPATDLRRFWGGVGASRAPVVAHLCASADVLDEESPRASAPTTLLDALQHALRRDEMVAPSSGRHDASVLEHRCVGLARQAEVLRDAIVHDLAAHPEWDESDLLVVCPDVERAAPALRAAFGPPRRRPGEPGLAYRVVDPAVGGDGLYRRAVRHLLVLLRGRVTRSDLHAFLAEPAVARRTGLVDGDLERLAEWSQRAGVRWGLSAAHRERFGVTQPGDRHTWRRGLDRLALGAMVDETGLRSVAGAVPVEVAAGEFVLLAAITRVVELLDVATSDLAARPLAAWATWFARLLDGLVEVPASEEGDALALRRALDEMGTLGPASSVVVAFEDYVALVLDALRAAGGPGPVLTGGITVTSPDTLRGVPFRAVYVLGLDAGAFEAPDWERDDLRRLDPRPGDVRPDDDARRRLAEVVLAAGERLTILRDDRDATTGQPVPEGVAYSELRDACVALVGDRFERDHAVAHPRHGFDVASLDPEEGRYAAWRERGVLGAGRAFATSARDLEVATALASGGSDVPVPSRVEEARFVLAPTDVAVPEEVGLDDLVAFVRSPVRAHVVGAFAPRLERRVDESEDDLAVEWGNGALREALPTLWEVVRERPERLEPGLDALVAGGDLPEGDASERAAVCDEVRALVGWDREWRRGGARRLPVRRPGRAGRPALVGEVEVVADGARLGVVSVAPFLIRYDGLLGTALAAIAARTATEGALVVRVARRVRGARPGVVAVIEREVAGTAASAAGTLDEIVDLYVENLATPWPVEWRWAKGSTPPSEADWTGRPLSGPALFLADPAWEMRFGHLSAVDVATLAHWADGAARLGSLIERHVPLTAMLDEAGRAGDGGDDD